MDNLCDLNLESSLAADAITLSDLREATSGEPAGHSAAKRADTPQGRDDMTNPPTNFLKYIDTPVEPYILPIIPASATLHADSKIEAVQLGKIPGKRRPDGTWTGFYAWQSNRTTALIARALAGMAGYGWAVRERHSHRCHPRRRC